MAARTGSSSMTWAVRAPLMVNGVEVEQRGAGGVHAERVEDEVRVGEEQGGAEEEGGGGDVAGDGGIDGFEALVAGDAQPVAGPRQGCAEGFEGVLGVVAGADGF